MFYNHKHTGEHILNKIRNSSKRFFNNNDNLIVIVDYLLFAEEVSDGKGNKYTEDYYKWNDDEFTIKMWFWSLFVIRSGETWNI